MRSRFLPWNFCLSNFGLAWMSWLGLACLSTLHAGWDVAPDAPTKTLQWPASLKLNIPQPEQRDEILFPRENSEFCVVSLHTYESDQAELWNLMTGKPVKKIKGTPPKSLVRALSGDGRWMALKLLDNPASNQIEIWSFETGELQCRIFAAEQGMSTGVMEFLPGRDELVTFSHGTAGTAFQRQLKVWDVTKGQIVREWNVPKSIQKCDISSTGQWLAWPDGSDVAFLDLKTGAEIGRFPTPSKTEDGSFVRLEEVRISPDGNEIACVLTGQSAWVIEVHKLSDGSRDFQLTIPISNLNQLSHIASYKGPKLDYVQQPAGFLLGGGGFVDRESGLMPWTYAPGLLEFSHWKRMLTPAGLIVSTGDRQARKIEAIPFPAEKLEKSLKAYHQDVPAIVKPGAKVKLLVKVDKVRFGTVEGTKSALEDALAERLAEDGLEVADDGETIMTVNYGEAAGKQLQEIAGGSPFRGGGTATGRSVQSTAGVIDIDWVSKDKKTKIYADKIELDPNTLIIRQGEVLSEENIRSKVFGVVKARLAGLPLPYFVPDDKSISNLPLVTSTTSKPLSKEEALKKKIEDKKAPLRRRR